MLHVVHEVKPHRARRTGLQRGEDAGLTIGRRPRRAFETGLAQQPDRQVAAFGNPAVLRRDGWLADPGLEPSDGLVLCAIDNDLLP